MASRKVTLRKEEYGAFLCTLGLCNVNLGCDHVDMSEVKWPTAALLCEAASFTPPPFCLSFPSHSLCFLRLEDDSHLYSFFAFRLRRPLRSDLLATCLRVLFRVLRQQRESLTAHCGLC